MKIAKEPISLETPIGDEEDSHLGDFIGDKNAVIPVRVHPERLACQPAEGRRSHGGRTTEAGRTCPLADGLVSWPRAGAAIDARPMKANKGASTCFLVRPQHDLLFVGIPLIGPSVSAAALAPQLDSSLPPGPNATAPDAHGDSGPITDRVSQGNDRVQRAIRTAASCATRNSLNCGAASQKLRGDLRRATR
jgi:hypothetical protein